MNEVLVIEDDYDLSALLKIHLTKNNFKPHFCRSVKEIPVSVKQFDLILLDLILPDGSGITLCERIRKSDYMPIIFMSCMGESEYKIQALRAGGDDFMVKPLDYNELITRIRVHLRRVNEYQVNIMQERYAQREVNIRGLSINYALNQVTRNGELLSLSPLEFDILAYLVRCKDRLVDYDSIYKNVWNCDSYGDVRTVMVHVCNLRKKIETASVNYIKTVRNKGYILCDECKI